MKKLLQSLCWWILMLFISYSVSAQVQYKVEFNNATQRYQVTMKPLANYSGSAANTGSAQVTLVVPTGNFTPTALQSQFGSWNLDNAIVRSPSENPSFDYVSFYMPSTVSGINYVNGVEMPLFSFAATGNCTGGINLINNANDPFFPSPITGTNSQNINVGNQISVFGYQNNLLANAWQSNYGSAAACPNTNNACIIQYEIVKTGNTYQVNMIPNVTYLGVANTTSTQQVTIKAPTGLAYTNLTSLTAGASYVQGSRVNAPAQSAGNDYIMFNLASLGTTALTYTNGVRIPLFKFDVPSACNGALSFMANNDPFTSNLSYNSKQQVTMFGYGQPDAPICFTGSGSVPCTNAPPAGCALQYQITKTGNTYQVNMIPNVTYTGTGNTTSTQQVTIKAPTGLAYTNLTSLTAGASYVQGSRVNAPSQSTGNDYIMFNLSNLGTTALTYTAGVSVPLFKFDVPGTCSGSIGFMPDTDPFTTNISYNSKQQITMFGYGQPDAPICFTGTGSVACPTVAPSCGIEYELELLANGKYQVSMIPKVTYVAPNNITSTQQITLKVPTGFQYTGLTNLTGATYVQGSRVNTPSQASSFDYIMFNLSNLGTSALTYTNGVKVPLFTFDKSGLCKGTELALMPDTDPFTANTSFNSKQQLTVLGYGQPDIPICLKGTGKATCTDNNPATCTIKYELETVNGCEYRVSMIPDVSWTSPNDITKAAKVTLRVPHGCFTVSDLTSLNFGANFAIVGTALAPSDNPAYDYICFGMTTVPTVGVPYIQNQKVNLFTFKNSGTCCGNIELMPFSDPFAHGNSLNQNFDQYWQTSGTGNSGTEPCIVGNAQPCVSAAGSNILGTDRTICAGQTAQLNVTGTYTSYNWTGAGLSATNISNPTVSPLTTTTYYVTATTASGCPIKDDVIVNVTTAPTIASVTAAPSSACASNTGTITVSATGSGTIEYSINNGTNWQLSNVFANLAAGSYSVKIRQQGTTCETTYPTNPVLVTSAGSPNIINVSGVNPSCGTNNGQIAITVNSSGGPFRYSIDNGTTYQLSDMFAGLATGTYNIKVSDLSGACSTTYSNFILVAPTAPTITSITPTNTSDCTLNNGSLSVNATGTAPLYYSIDGINWQTSNVFLNLAAGSYLVKVRSGNTNSCVTTATAPTSVNTPITPAVQSITSVTPSTCALANGSISVTATGGAGTFEYSKDNGVTWQSSNTFAALASGTYYIKVRTVGSNCSAQYPGNPVVLNTTSAPAITGITKTNTSNCGLNDGQIIVSAIGTGVLEYSINNGTSYQTSNTFNNLAAGTFNIIVRSASNATCTSVVPNCVIPALTQATINNFAATATSNCSSNDGTITINASGGVAPLQYSINGTTWQSSNIFIGVAPGSYTLRVRNANASCVNTGNTIALVTQPSAPSITSATATAANCGQINGSITISTNGGIAPLSYSIDNIFWQTSNIFNNVPAGTYTAYVRNANAGCATPSNAPVVVTQSTGPNMTGVTVTNSNTCISPNGAIAITAAGGTQPLQYSIDGGINFQTSNSFVGVAAGIYNLVVRNANTTCPAMLSPIVITAPSAPQIVTTLSVNPLGCTVNNGSIQILANTSVPVEYSLDGNIWQTSNTFSNLGAGSYTARVRNIGNATCMAVASTPIVLTPTSTTPSITTVSKTNPSACGSASGTITITANPSTSVQYSIDNIHWQTANLFSNIVAGSYTVYVRNANGTCPIAYSANPVVLTAPGAQSITNVSLTNPSTCGINDGQISITVAGTGGPYRYSINGGTSYQTSPYFGSLAAGTYNILVSMSNGDCPTSVPAVSLTAPTAPTIISVTPSNISDCNLANGSISIAANGGTAPLEYSIDGINWQSGNTFANLSAGSYLARVRNANNSCITTASAAVTVSMPQMPSISNVVAIAPTACGTANGSITVTGTGGTAPLQYSIDNGVNWSSNATFNSLASGTYYVMVRNNGGFCAKAYQGNPIVINATGAPSIINITKTLPSTCGVNNGSIVISAAGSGVLEYSINNGTTYQNSNTFSNLPSGNYNIVVRIIGGNAACTSSVPNCAIPVLVAPALLSATATPSSDCTQNDGTITVNATGGMAPLYFSIDGNTWQTANVFTSVSAGTYTVRVRNANGTCTQTATTQTTVTQPTAPTSVSGVATAAACGQTNGTITASANGGTAPLQYSIDNINWQTSNTFANVAAGTYTVYARNANASCKTPSSATVTVANTNGANITNVTITNSTTCGVNNGEINITATGGTAPLSYSINGGVTFQASSIFGGLAAGTYNIVVRNANASCPAMLPPVTLTAPLAPSILSNIATNPSACTTTDGTITVFATGGNPPLEYSLDGNSWQASNVFNNLAAGSYTTRVRNGNGSCVQTATTPIVLTTPTAAIITNIAKTDPTSCGTANGSVTITATPNVGVQYSIDNIHWQTANIFNNLAAGSYTAYIRYNNGTCKNPFANPVSLNSAGAQSITNISVSNPTDCNKNDGQISITVSGTNGPFRYSINNGTTFQTSPMFVNLAAGTYNIIVTDASGNCSVTAPAVTITAPSAPQIAAVTPSATTDCGLNDGEINITAFSGIAPLQYSINGTTWQTSNLFTGVATGTYLIQVRNANASCKITANAPVTVVMPTMPIITGVAATAPATCGQNTGTISISAAGGAGQLEYSIDQTNWVTNPTFVGLASGTYYVFVRNQDNSCAKAYTGNPVVINASGTPQISNVTKTAPTNCNTTDGQIVITATGTSVLEYSINGGSSFQASNTFNNLASGTYNVMVRIAGGNAACTSSVPNCIIPTLTQPTISSVSSTNQTDCSQNTGSITVVANGGIAPLYYSINGTTWQQGNIFSGVAAGTYTVKVRNANGSCEYTHSASITVTQPSAASNISGVSTAAACGQTSGSITISASNGVAPLEYSINGIIWQTSNVFANVVAGTYTLYVRNAGATCVSKGSTNVTVSQTGGANISNVTVTNSTTCATSNGQILITATGGTPPLQYSINGGISYQASNTFNNVAAGSYNIAVTNTGGTCPAVLSPIVLTAPTAPTIVTAVSSSPTGCNLSDGTITVLANGNGVLEYSLDGNIWQTSNTFTNLAAANYIPRVRIQGSTTCIATATTPIVLSAPTAPIINSVTSTNPSACGTNNGTITVSSTPSVGVQYSINGIVWQNAGSFVGLASGSYNVKVRNISGTCVTDYASAVTLNATGGIQAISIVVNSDDCTIPNNGKVTILASGGTTPYSYTLNGGTPQISNIFTNLAAGSYTITVKDASNTCQNTLTATLTGPSAPTVPTATANATSDCNSSNGSISVISPLGASYEYSINNGFSWQSATTFNALEGGNYIISVRKTGTNCITSSAAAIVVATPAKPFVSSVTATNPSACAAVDGSINITATGGAAPLQYSIDGINWQANGSFNGLANGTYTVFVRNQNAGCVTPFLGNPVVLNNSQAPAIVGILVEQADVCNGTNGKITITANGATEYSKDNGLTWQASNVFANLAAGTYNLKARASATCVSNYVPISIQGNSAPTAMTVAATPSSDCNLNNGTLQVTNVTGGTAPYEYSINGTTWQTSNTFAGLAAGSYTVRLRNAGQICIFTNTTLSTIGQPTAPIINSVTKIDAPCGSNSGQITVSASTGALISIDGLNYQTNGTFTNLAPGTYMIFIKNANGTCATPYSNNPLVISTGIAPSVSNVTATNPTDCNLNNGTINITATGGTAPLSYSIDGGATFQASNVFNNIAAGSYSIVVRGSGASANCPVTYAPISIKAPATPRIIANISTNPSSCLSNGNITVIASDGNAPLSYSIDGINWQTSNIFNNLATGSYTIRVRNNNTSCIKTNPTASILTAPSSISITNIVKTDPTTCIAANGTITMTASPNVQFSIDNIHWQTSNVFSNLAAGAYTAYIRNADGTCPTPYLSNPVILNGAGAPIISAVDKMDVSDCNKIDGAINIHVTGNAAQYKYSIDNGLTYQLSTYFSGLTAGTYTVKVTDLAGNCPATVPNIVITAPTGATITAANATPTSNCGVNNGSIAITATGANVQYSINNGANWTTSNIFNNLATGSYLIKVRNTDGKCEQTYPNIVEVKEPAKPIFVSVTNIDPLVCGQNTGSITIIAAGGTGTYEYSINGATWQTSGAFTSLTPGAYTVMVRNAGSNCPVQYTGLINIAAPPAPSYILVNAQNPTTCLGNNGKITIIATGSSPLEYSINNGVSYQASSIFNNVVAGNYNIRVRNVGGTCEMTYPLVTLAAPTPPTILATTPTPTSDCNGNDGKITVLATSANVLEYSIDNINWQSSNTFMNLLAGTYTVRVRDLGTTCAATASPVTISQPNNAPIISNVTKTNPTGCGKNDGSITITATPNVGVMYTIDGINWTTNNTFANLTSGSYTVKVRNANGSCSTPYASLTILTPGPTSPQVSSVSVTNVSDCAATNGVIAITATGGTAPYQYSIDGGTTFQNTATYNNLPAGFYDILVRNNDNSCATLHVPVEVKAPATPALVTAILTKPSDCAIPNAKITVYASGGIQPLQYSIDNGTTWTTNNTFSNLSPGYYYIKVRNANGTCEQVYGPNPVKSCEFDLALRKKLTNKADTVTSLGRDVDFTIKVYNQGAVAAKDVEVVDYLPTGMMLSPTDQNGWSMLPQIGKPAGTTIQDPSLPMTAKKIITQTIAPGDSAEIHIKLRVMFGAAFAKLKNVAEIAGAKDEAGVTRQDGDSTPDGTKGNDKEVDDTIDDKGTVDEDDEDPAPLQLDAYDPHGYIYCDKSNTLLKGGKIILVSGPVGGSIFFATDNNGLPIDGRDGVYQFFTNGIPGNYTMGYTHPQGYVLSPMRLPQVGSFNPANTDNTVIDKDLQANNIVTLGSSVQGDSLIKFASIENPYYMNFTFNANETTIISHNNLPVSCACATVNVCVDTNGDGIPTPGETGVNGATIELYNCATNTLAQTGVTINGGKLKLSGLLAGNYRLKYTPPAGYVFATNPSGQTVGIDNQGNTTCFALGYAGCEEKSACVKLCPTITVSPNVTICAGSNTILSVTGGSVYSWSPALGLNTTSGASVTASPATTTTYTVTNSANGCVSTANVTVTVVAPPSSNFTINTTQPSTCTNSNGSITVNATGALEYSVNNGAAWQASNIFNALPAGTYIVRIRTIGTTCAVSYASNPVDLTPTSAANISNVASVNPTNCTVPNGTITITATGGTAPLQYSINNGLSYQAANQFANLAAGTYKIKVKNGDNTCEISYPDVTLTNNSPIINAVNVISDCANNNRSITILASGGVSPLEYSINGGTSWTTNNNFTNLAPGTYNVAVRNFNGSCVVNYTGGTITMCNYDLALTKKLAAGQATVVRLGDVINYEITVFNQGSNPVKDVALVDYLPQGMQLSPAGNNGWAVVAGTDMISNTITTTIPAGQSITLNLSVRLVFGSPNASLKNVAEIKSMKDTNGNAITDVDSTPDMTKGNDTEKDDVTNEDGKNTNGNDEDDSDFANITLDNFDPSGYIYCEKTGKIITGGKVKLVSAPQGGDIFFATDNNGKLLDGTSGMYQIFTNGVSGIYTFTYEHPNNYPLSTTCLPQAGAFNPAGNDANPVYDKDGTLNGMIHLGSLSNGNGFLADKACAANKYFLSFNLEKDEKLLIATNNIPVSCAVITGTITNCDTKVGISGMDVKIFDCNSTTGVFVGTVKTDANGNYSFDDLKTGKYKIVISTPAGQIIQGGNFDQTGASACIDIKFGEMKMNVDACLGACPSINNVLTVMPWCPKNNGVIIIDAVCQGDLQYSIDGGKTYQHLNAFMNLAPGTYTIKVKSAGCEKEYDKVIVLACENDNGGGKGSISGKTFKSCSDSGIKGSSKGLAGVKVTLTSSTGTTLNTTTSATGTYNFANVEVGTYTITFEKASGFDFAKQNQGNDDTNDSDVDATGKTSVTLAANQLVDNVDAGFKDVQAPTITFIHPLLVGKKDGETVYMECGFEEVLKATDATAKDNCDVNPIVKMEDGPAIVSKVCDKDGYLVKMECGWIATDECGNKTQIWLFIVVRDTKAPDMVGVPSNITITDKDVVPTPATVLAKDKCDKDAKVIFAENKTGNVITRTWTANDACGNKTTATQTITITPTTNNPCTISIAPVPVVYPATCAGKDGKAKLTPSTYTYKWADGIVGDTRLDLGKGIYSVTATDASGCTLAFTVEIKDACTQAVYKFASKGEIRQVACSTPQKDYCLDVDYADFMLNYNLTENGIAINGKIKPCGITLHGEYSLSGLINATLSVENWIVDGQNISFDFIDLNDLVAKMNQYDSNGGWKLNALDATVENANFKKNRYGNLIIGKKQFGLQWIIQASEFSLSKGINFMVEGMGKHEIVMRHKSNNASDTMRLQFVCTTPSIFDVVVQEGDIKGVDIATTELVGAKCVIENHDDALQNNAAMFHNSGRRPSVINVEGMYQGAKQVMFTMCDEHNICDTATIRVIVYAKEKVIVEKDKTLKVFTGFSPNDDGVNDTFTIENIEYYPENTLTVFNRWGNVIYSKEGYDNRWQGTFDNANLPDGTYFYHLEIKGQKTRSGYVELRR